MTNSKEKSPREIIDAYSPITRGKKGLLGFALKAVARPLEASRNMLGALAHFPIGFGYENSAGQILTGCEAVIPDTFARMEKKLQASFNIASQREASPIERENFLHLAEEVRGDAEVLSHYCTILRTEFDSVTERYNFILSKNENATVTLEQGVAAVRRELIGPTVELPEVVTPVAARRSAIQLQPHA